MSEFNTEDLDEVIASAESSLVQMLALQLKNELVKNAAITSQLESVVAENAALKALCEDRRQFILNGVEMGFIRLPDKDIKDPAKATYERCLSGVLAAPCQKCNDTGMTDSGGTQPWGEPIEIECDCGAAHLRQGGSV